MKYFMFLLMMILPLMQIGCLKSKSSKDSQDPLVKTITVANWSEKTPTTIRSASTRANHAFHSAVVYGSNMYVFGGIDAGGVKNDLLQYDFLANTWTTLTPGGFLPIARQKHSAVINGDKMYVFGGVNSGGNALRDVWVYDITANTWTQRFDAPIYRYGHGAAIYTDEMYVFCGLDGANNPTNTIWKYNFAGDSWVQVIPSGGILPAARSSCCATSFSTIFMHNGNDGTLNWDNYLYAYDFANNLWIAKTRFGEPRDFQASSWANSKLYVFGGRQYDGEIRNDLWEFDPYFYPNQYATTSTEVCTLVHGQDITRTPGPRWGASGISYNSSFYVYGGMDSGGNYLNELWECGFTFRQVPAN